MTDLAILKERLEQAENALHQLVLGDKMVEIRVNGRWLQKTPADAPQLRSYIKDLQNKVNRQEGKISTGGPINLVHK